MITSLEQTSLNLDTPWSLGESAFDRLVAIAQNLPQLKTLVEFGSGKSSIRLAQTFPEAHIYAIESDRHCFRHSQALAQRLAPHNLTVLHQPLAFQPYGPGEILTYTPAAVLRSLTIDCAIIDGPAFYTLRGREACLYQIYDQLTLGGVVILDDYRRPSEKAMVQNWQAVYPNSFTAETVPVGHRLAVLTKQTAVTPHWHHPTKQNDSQRLSQSYGRMRSLLHQCGTDPQLRWLNQQGPLGQQMAQVLQAMQTAYSISPDNPPRSRIKTTWDSLQACLQLARLAR
jgi:predicted O-methyltransferase YrrM